MALYAFVASALGLKETLPPYLNKNLTLEDLKTGVTFASAGSGYNNATCKTSVSRPFVDLSMVFALDERDRSICL